jgi:nucleoside-diphosphate-sugar epimerase
MNVLLTGAFGNIGLSTLEELLKRGHTVRCFDLGTRANKKVARRFGDQIDLVWGDLRKPQDLVTAVEDQDVIVHLAFVIPKMSHTGVESEARPEWAYKVNVDGTRNLLQAAMSLSSSPRFLFSSSYHVYGRTQHLLPPRLVSDPVRPVEHYSHHKVLCEQMVRGSNLAWAILRLSATLPLRLQLDPGMFDVPLDNRMEFTHTRDVGVAIANAIDTEEVWGQTWLIGGGLSCQYVYREIVSRSLQVFGLGMLPEEAFGSTSFPTDWVDTVESQRVLDYQSRDLGDYLEEMKISLGARRHLVRIFRPLVRWYLLRKSPHYRQARDERPELSEAIRVPL